MSKDIGGVLVEFGIELTVRTPEGRKKRIAQWDDAPQQLWAKILGLVIAKGTEQPSANDDPHVDL